MSMRDSPNFLGTGVDDLEPSPDRLRSYLASLADAFSLPRRFVQATAETEGGFDPQTVRARSLPPSSVLPLPPALSEEGLQFIARHEAKPDGKPALTAYPDIYGNPTIGYGHAVKPGENFSAGITEKQAMDLLLQDSKAAEAFVRRNVQGNLTQSQFDALVSVAFNSPRAALRLANRLNKASKIETEDFINSLPQGAASPGGLINRRTDEANLYLRGDYARQHK